MTRVPPPVDERTAPMAKLREITRCPSDDEEARVEARLLAEMEKRK